MAFLVVVFACSTIAQYWCHDHHDQCDHHGHDCHDQYWYHDRLTPFRGNCRLCFTWFQPIAGFWLLSPLLIIGPHCVSFSIPQHLDSTEKKHKKMKNMAKVVWPVITICHTIDIRCHSHIYAFDILFSGHDVQSGCWSWYHQLLVGNCHKSAKYC